MPIYAISTPDTMRRLEAYQVLQREVVELQRTGSVTALEELLPRLKLIVLVTSGIHASEVGATQMSPELLHHFAHARGEPTRTILNEAIVLLAPSLNPSGLNLVHDWYTRTLSTRYEGSNPPYPDHPVGHDVNRDWTMRTQPETRSLTEHVLNAWRPHVHLDLHQMQSSGPRYVVPPFVDPIDPHVPAPAVGWMDQIGEEIGRALRSSKHRGIASGVIFDAYTPGRSYVNYHGGLRMLAEAASAKIATPANVPVESMPVWRGFDPHVASPAQPHPWPGGVWSLRDVMRLHYQSTMALLASAVAHRSELIRDLVLPKPAEHDPQRFLIFPYSLQRDAGTTVELIETLISADVTIERVSTSTIIDDVTIPPGGYLVRTDQPNGAFVRTLFSRTAYPGDELSKPHHPHVPYDVTGHTLPLTMGVDVISLPSERDVAAVRISTPDRPRGWIRGAALGAYVIPAGPNSAFLVANQAIASGASVARLVNPTTESGFPLGAFVLSGLPRSQADQLLEPHGLIASAVDDVPGGSVSVRRTTVGVYRSWRPNVPDAGWLDFVLRRFGYDVRTLRDKDIRAGAWKDLAAIILPSQQTRELLHGNSGTEYPDEFCGGIGRTGMTSLRTYTEQGGHLIAIDAACDAALSSLPTGTLNSVAGLGPELFQTPGAIVRLNLDVTHPIAWGMDPTVAAVVTNSPVFDLRPGHAANPHTVARYPEDDPLLSGWLVGRSHLAGRAALVDISFGRGKLVLFGLRPYFRAQTHGTYGLLFNALTRAAMAGGQTVESHS